MNDMEMQLSQYQHQIYTPVPSIGKVSALLCRNVDPLGRRHEYTGGCPHKVSATGTRCSLVGSCLQRKGALAIWFVNHLSLFGHVACLDPGVPAHDALRLMVDTKAESQCRAGDHRVALATSGSARFRRMPTLYCYLHCGDLISSGVMERRNSPLGLRDDNNDDDDDDDDDDDEG